MSKDTFALLQGQVIALTYALDLCLKHHPRERDVLVELQAKLDGLSASMLERGEQEAADGVERIRLALLSGGAISP